MKKGFVKSFDNNIVYRYLWDDVENPKGIVQIIHGMSEHAKRYEDFALFLNKNGYIVFANDLRGHGKTSIDIDNLGKYQGIDVVWDSLMDEMFFTRQLKEKYNLPVHILGHSYGSFLALAYMQKSRLYSKSILCGSALLKGMPSVKLAKIIAKITIKNKGPEAPAELLDKLTFGKYDKQTKNGSWLNSSNDLAARYYQDKYCGFIMSAKFYYNFFSIFDWLYKHDFMDNLDKDKPIYLISGKEDKLSKNGKLVQKLFKFLAHQDVKQVKMNLYSGCRHEILHETNKEKVYKDILKFLDK